MGSSSALPAPRPTLVYSGQAIRDRDEMMCLTDMWRAAGADPSKSPFDWRRLPATGEFADYVAANAGLSRISLFRSPRGRGEESGTWAHWQIAFAYAKYLSPEFHAWCNDVVRSHMEERGLPVAQATAVALTRNDLDGFARIVGEASGRAAAERCVELMDNRIDAHVAPLRDAMASQRAELASQRQEMMAFKREVMARRKQISAQTKAGHVRDTFDMGGKCPCCRHAMVVGPDGVQLRWSQFDHFYQNSLPNADHSWLICVPCHKQLSDGIVPRHEREAMFRSYQDARSRLPGRQPRLF